MDIVQLYQDYSVDFKMEGHKHCRPGWVNTACPHCTGSPGYHLGYDMQGNYYTCWRCGWHPVTSTIAKLINVRENEVRILIGKYGLLIPKVTKGLVTPVNQKDHKLPSNVGPLTKIHRRYLTSRGFNPDDLITAWNLVGVGPSGILDGIDYKLRILAPVIWNTQQVSFQARDVTGKDPLRYRACPKDREIIHHKDILYGDQSEWTRIGLCVEGITDVWRLGKQSFATFGIKYTPSQLRIIAQSFDEVAVLFDPDPQAVKQAKKLVADLKFRGLNAYRVPINKDPGSMSQDKADALTKEILKN